MTEGPWELPPSWHWASFRDVAVVASDLVDPTNFPDFPHIAPNHIESGTGRLLPFTTVKADGVTSAKHRFKAGQVLYSKIRPYLAKVAIADFDGLCSADMYPVDTQLNPRFLKWWMLTPEFTRQAAGQQARTVLPKINRRALSSLAVPVAPIEEQQRIVEILEDHLSRLDAGVDLLAASEKRLRPLTRSTLQTLIPDKYPTGWRRVRVGEAGHVDLGRQRHPDWHHGPEMKPYLRVANVFEDRIDTTDVMEMDFSGGIFERFRLKPADILLNEGQSPEWLGRPAMYRGELGEVAFTNSLLRFRAGEGVLPEWALLVFRRHMHCGRFRKEARITTNIAHLSAARLKSVEFPVPPVDEQHRLLRQADDQLTAISRLRVDLERQQAQQRGLRRSLLSAAFSGCLTKKTAGLRMMEEMAGV